MCEMRERINLGRGGDRVMAHERDLQDGADCEFAAGRIRSGNREWKKNTAKPCKGGRGSGEAVISHQQSLTYRGGQDIRRPEADQAKRPDKDLERENTKLKRMVARVVVGRSKFQGCGRGKPLLSPERAAWRGQACMGERQ